MDSVPTQLVCNQRDSLVRLDAATLAQKVLPAAARCPPGTCIVRLERLPSEDGITPLNWLHQTNRRRQIGEAASARTVSTHSYWLSAEEDNYRQGFSYCPGAENISARSTRCSRAVASSAWRGKQIQTGMGQLNWLRDRYSHSRDGVMLRQWNMLSIQLTRTPPSRPQDRQVGEVAQLGWYRPP